VSGLVYVADWEIQCCGEEFAVGDEVAWPVAPADHADPFWEPLLGPRLASALTGSYQAHEEETPPQIRGTVLGIRTVSCRYAPVADGDAHLRPVLGTTVLERVEAIEKWYGGDADPLVLGFSGWLVDLEPAL
jgi:hypothetical protein